MEGKMIQKLKTVNISGEELIQKVLYQYANVAVLGV